MAKLYLAGQHDHDPAKLPLHKRLLAGACAGLCYWTLTYPLDVVKGRMQATPFEQRLSWSATFQSIHRSSQVVTLLA